jgi:hypothetical protein
MRGTLVYYGSEIGMAEIRQTRTMQQYVKIFLADGNQIKNAFF